MYVCEDSVVQLMSDSGAPLTSLFTISSLQVRSWRLIFSLSSLQAHVHYDSEMLLTPGMCLRHYIRLTLPTADYPSLDSALSALLPTLISALLPTLLSALLPALDSPLGIAPSSRLSSRHCSRLPLSIAPGSRLSSTHSPDSPLPILPTRLRHTMRTPANQLVRVRWEGNGSKAYDSRTQDISRKAIKSGDVMVGSTVTIEWGRQSRVWTAVVMDVLDQPSPTPPPAKRQKLLGEFFIFLILYCTTVHIPMYSTSIIYSSYTCATERPTVGLPSSPPSPASSSSPASPPSPSSLKIGEFCMFCLHVFQLLISLLIIYPSYTMCIYTVQ